MSIKFSITQSSLNGKDTYYARTVVNKVYNAREFVERMVEAGNYKTGEYECFFRELMTMLGKVIVEGNGISIDRKLRIVPAIKGGFDSTKDSFDRTRNSLSVNVTLSKNFISQLMPLINFERIEPRTIVPSIREIKENPLKANLLFLSINNNIDGNDFTCEGLTFEGIEIISLEDDTLKQDVPAEHIHVYQAGKKRFSFIFRREFQPAEWLANGSEIILILKYVDDELNQPIRSNPHLTRWAVDDKIELPELVQVEEPVLS